jgi:glutathione peroxidase-family protein
LLEIGLNTFEIISVAETAGKMESKLPQSDIWILNHLQEKYKIVFNLKQKIENKDNFKIRTFSYLGEDWDTKVNRVAWKKKKIINLIKKF